MNASPINNLTIVGASTRAAAVSAVSGGITPDCFDLFADVDLRQVGKVTRWLDYPERLADLLDESAGEFWMYTGALENHPGEIAAGCVQKQLLGNDEEVIERVRDPFWLCEYLGRWAGSIRSFQKPIGFPEVRRYDSPPNSLEGWLDKPFASAGGLKIHPAISMSHENHELNGNESECRYWQRLIDGESLSGVFLAERGAAMLLGATRQLVGEFWLSAPKFAYCGSSFSPNAFSTAQLSAMQSLGDDLAHETGLTGLFGIDFICTSNGELIVLEVNPRYPASCELIEMALGLSLVQLHVESCLPVSNLGDSYGSAIQRASRLKARPPHGPREFRKAILYADRPLIIPEGFFEWATRSESNPFAYVIADIPAAGELIPQGGPICTMITKATDSTVADQQIRQLAASVQSRLNAAKSFDP